MIITYLLLSAVALTDFAYGEGGRVKVVFYNVENLFDYRHDEGKRDWTFLPLGYPGKRRGCERIPDSFFRQMCLETDWNRRGFEIKLGQIKKAVMSGGRPDILGLSEVENSYAARKIAERLGYNSYLVTAGPDPRGIDVALLYDRDNPVFTYVRHREHSLKLSRDLRKPTRNILEVEFFLPATQEKLIVYVVHWPSPRNPSMTRMVAARKVVKLSKKHITRDRRASVLVIGDFNVVPGDHPHPFRELFDGYLYDTRKSFMRDKSIAREKKISMPAGTHFYPPTMHWTDLDRIFYSRSLQNDRGLEVDIGSYSVLAPSYATKTFVYKRVGEFLFGSEIKNVPKRYNFSAVTANDAGFSDHFAVSVDLVTRVRTATDIADK